jgi:hypothetical protein
LAVSRRCSAGARVALAVGLLHDAEAERSRFAEWTRAMCRSFVVLFGFCYFLLTDDSLSIDIQDVAEADTAIEEQIRDSGPAV